MREEQKKVIQKEMDRLENYSERTDWLQVTSCLSKMEKSKFILGLQ